MRRSGEAYIVHFPGVEKMGHRKLRRLANRRNRRVGVSAAAASALNIEWKCDFKAVSMPPIDPADCAQLTRDLRAKEQARQGEHADRPASGGYLRIVTATNNFLNWRHPIWRDEIRHSWLMAHYEYDWANVNGRVEWVPSGRNTRVPSSDVRKLLPTERAAHRVCEAARAYSDILHSLRRFSKGGERW